MKQISYVAWKKLEQEDLIKKAIPGDMKKSLSVEHNQFYRYNKNQEDLLFTFSLFQ
jgi:hypothetical protein